MWKIGGLIKESKEWGPERQNQICDYFHKERDHDKIKSTKG